jgi:hypothetical protein
LICFKRIKKLFSKLLYDWLSCHTTCLACHWKSSFSFFPLLSVDSMVWHLYDSLLNNIIFNEFAHKWMLILLTNKKKKKSSLQRPNTQNQWWISPVLIGKSAMLLWRGRWLAFTLIECHSIKIFNQLSP